MKTVREKFRSMQAEREETNDRNINISGLAEEAGPVEQLLEEFLL